MTAGCKPEFECHVGGDGKDGMMADIQGTVKVSGIQTGKCVCFGATKYFHMGVIPPCSGTAKNPPGVGGTASHDAVCMAGSTDSAMCKYFRVLHKFLASRSR